MLGAIIGDIVGSRFEWHNLKSRDFPLFGGVVSFTDDTVMTIAIAKALLEMAEDGHDAEEQAIKYMRLFGQLYPRAGYGKRFSRWLRAIEPKPYGSYGNGAPMRISAVGHWGKSEAEVKALSHAVTGVTHNHPEAFKAAEAVAMAVYWLRQGMAKEEVKAKLEKGYYDLSTVSLEELHRNYDFDITCQGTMPAALTAFFAAEDFESALRNCIYIGGDADTIGAIVGALAEVCYGIPKEIEGQAQKYLTEPICRVLEEFNSALERR